MIFHVAGVKYRLAQLLGDDSLMAESLDYCRQQNIKDPTRMFDTVIPGFSPTPR